MTNTTPPTADPGHQPLIENDSDGILVVRESAPRRLNLAWVIPAVTVGVLAIVGATAATTATLLREDAPEPAVAADATPPSAWQQEQQAANAGLDEGELGVPAAEETSGPMLAAADITLTPKVIDKQCFGSAGCSVEIEVKMAYSGPDLSPNDTFEVTYEVQGDEDGPVIGQFEVTGGQYTEQEESLSTRSSSTKISIKVTDVEKAGV